MSRRAFVMLSLLLIFAVGGVAFLLASGDSSEQATTETAEKKAAHFEYSTPASNAALPAPPPNVTIDFNFDLAAGSSINIDREGREYGEGDTSIDDNKLAMRRNMSQDAPDGAYIVSYTACWPDGSCHDGRFSFNIDRTAQTGFMDMTSEPEVTIRMSQIKFVPMEVRISQNTKVTWVNDDEEVHYINTDAHPSHTHVLDFNSKALNKDESYSFTFEKSGAYPYHCSAHASTMIGAIVVES